MFATSIILFAASCDKKDKPTLGDYPTDSNPPGGPLKFYSAFDGRAVDSIRALFGTDNGASYTTTGVSGGALQLDGSTNGYVTFPSVNDFGGSTSFTMSFWMNITMAQKDNSHAVGVLAFANSDNFWGNITVYMDNNTKSPSDSMDLKMHFGATNGDGPGRGDNWNFAGYNFANAWPKMYDGQWHQVAFTYDATAQIATVYRDGAQFDQKTGQQISFGSTSKLVLGGFEQAAEIQGNYAGNSWMAGFPGMLDQVRFYGTALTPSEVEALYVGKK